MENVVKIIPERLEDTNARFLSLSFKISFDVKAISCAFSAS